MKTVARPTPNALPPVILPLGERFGNASITTKAAQDITTINCITIGDKCDDEAAKAKHGYPYHLVDIWYRNAEGRDSILARSRPLRINQKQLRTFMREITRKVAVFIFENKG